MCDDGRIGLIDYGQVKEVDKITRIRIAKICTALLHDDEETVLKIQVESGFRTRDMNPYVLTKHARLAW